MSGPPWVDDPGPAVEASSATFPAGRPVVQVVLHPQRVEIILWLLVGGLVSLVFLVSIVDAQHLLPYTLTRFFDATDTQSLLSGALITLLLLADVLLAGCALAARRRDDGSAPGWKLLALAGGFALLDEITRLHRSLNDVLDDRYDLAGPQRYGWALLYLPAAIAVLVALMRYLRRTPRGVLRRLVPGVVLYAVGAMGLEPVASALAEGSGKGTTSFTLVAATAGSAQLVGLALVGGAALVAATGLARGFAVVLAGPENG